MTRSSSTSSVTERPDERDPHETLLDEAALAYAARGWRVFPVQARGKLPAISKEQGGQGFKDATTDTTTILNWWLRMPNANIGVATGAESGIVVLDVDLPKGGKESFHRLTAAFPKPALLSLVQGTGGGGFHVIYGHPGYRVSNSAKGLKERFGPGLDIRGDGGYIVVAPSIHESGRRYAWQTDPGPIEVWPSYLNDLLAPIPRPVTNQPRIARVEDARRTRTDIDYYWRMILRRRLDDLDQAGGNRNDALNEAAFRMGQIGAIGAPIDTIRSYLVQAGNVLRARGWADTERQMENTVDSGLRAGQEHPDTWFGKDAGAAS